jgi:hypothetical protein
MIVKNKYATYVGYGFAEKFGIHAQKWTAPDAAAVNNVLAATLLTTAVQTVTTGITNPDFPRLLVVDGGDGNVTGNVVITGTDIRGNAISDTIALSGTDTVPGIKAFKTVTSIQLPVYAVAGTETVSVGVSDVLGLEMIPAIATAISAHSTATLEGTLPTLTVHATDISRNLCDFNTACNATADKFVVFYTADQPSRNSRTS